MKGKRENAHIYRAQRWVNEATWTNQKLRHGIFLEKLINAVSQPIRLWHMVQSKITKSNQRKDDTWHINWPLKCWHVSKANSYTIVFWTTLGQRGQLMVNQKLDHLQFVHSVIQVQKGYPNIRRSSSIRRSFEGKKVVHHKSTWTTSQHLEIFRMNLCSKFYNTSHVLLFWSISKIFIHRYNFPLSS